MTTKDKPEKLGTYESQWVWLIEDRKLAMKRDPLICRSQRAFNATYFLWDHPDETNPASFIIRNFMQHAETRTFYPDEPFGIILKDGKRCLNLPMAITYRVSDQYEAIAA